MQEPGGSWTVQKTGGVTSDYGGGAASVNVLVKLVAGGTGVYVGVDSMDLRFTFSQ